MFRLLYQCSDSFANTERRFCDCISASISPKPALPKEWRRNTYEAPSALKFLQWKECELTKFLFISVSIKWVKAFLLNNKKLKVWICDLTWLACIVLSISSVLALSSILVAELQQFQVTNPEHSNIRGRKYLFFF